MKKISTLTKEQIDKFPEYVENYTRIGLNCDPIDFEKAKKAVEKVYICGGLKPPTKMIYCESPLSAIFMINILMRNPEVEDLSKENVNRIISEYTKDNIKIDFVNSTLEGQHNAGFVSFYEYFRNECGLIEETEKMTGIFELFRESGWVYLFEEIAFICDRHSKCYRDEKGRLHSNDCAAVEYLDGYKVYSWHGTRIPEYVIMNPESITLEDILEEKNQEIRRVKIMKFGIDNLVNSNQVKKIDEDSEFGELYHTINLKDVDGNPFAFLKVLNSTPEENGSYKSYMLRVDPSFKDTQKAWQSTFRKIKDFAPIKET